MESEGPEVLRQINKRVPLSDSRCAKKLSNTLSKKLSKIILTITNSIITFLAPVFLFDSINAIKFVPRGKIW